MGLRFWSKPCYTCDVDKSIRLGFLVNFECYGTNNGLTLPKIPPHRDFTATELSKSLKTAKIPVQIHEIIELSNKFGLKKVCIIAASIQHAEDIYEELVKKEECVLIHSKIKNANDSVEEYKTSNIRFSISIGMITEGFDAPIVDGIVLLRATNSSRLLTQIIGRGLRLFLGKKICIVLDYSGSVIRCGDPRNPIIPDPQKPKGKSEESPIKQCEECHRIFEKAEHGNKCPSCGHENKQECDVEANLKKSLMEDAEVFSFIVDRETEKIFLRTRNGARYMRMTVEGKDYSFFNFQYKSVLSSIKKFGKCKIEYTLNSKGNFKFLRATSAS